MYQVLSKSMARSRLDASGHAGLTPLVGREPEVALLRERWAQVKEGMGQVVLLSGEAGIGKSRLVQVLAEQVASEPYTWLTPCQCSPYHQNTALYPMMDWLERVVLRFEREESPPQKLRKLERFLVQYGLPLAETVPLLTALLSLPLSTDYTPLTLSPEQLKQQILHVLLTILLRIAAQQPALFVMEDLHWVDPSTLEFLTLLVDQGPTAPILALFTCRPDFSPPWTGRAHVTPVTLPRLPRRQAAELTSRVAQGKTLPAEVVAQVVAKTDGVPLFVEELTKMVLESGLLQEREERYELTGPLPPLAIPTTLHDSLMARLDRLAAVKGLAQLGATLGREFAYELLQAVSLWDEGTLRRGLQQLVAAEFLYQQGLPPQATYLFKHVLIQEAAYQSLLKSTRQQYHQRIAQVVETRFPTICETQPEWLAHHYTEAGAVAQAVSYWQQAGQHAVARSAHVEAISHLTRGLDLLTSLPDSPERRQQALVLLTTLGPAFTATKGIGAPETGHVYVRAHELCQQVGETPQLFPTLAGLARVDLNRGEILTARALGEQLLRLAHRTHDPALVMEAHRALGSSLFWGGELPLARAHLEEGLALYRPQQHGGHALLYGRDPGMECRGFAALTLWFLGYPDQAVARLQEARHLVYELTHPYSLATAFNVTAWLHQCRGEGPLTQERAEAVLALATGHGLAQRWASSTVLLGWTLAKQGRVAEGMAQLRQGLAAWQATGSRIWRPYFLALLADVCAHGGQVEEGLSALAEALAAVDKTGERLYEAELHRLKGKLLLALSAHDQAEATTCFQQNLAVARQQQAKSLELRAAMSLSRLWQGQGQRQEAYNLLAPIYGWFTEGFDTADLQEAKALLEALA